MEIKVLGPGCTNCVTLTRIVEEAVAELGVTANVIKVEDYADIASHGVMSTPALIIDGAIAVAGRVPTHRRVRELIEGAARTSD